MELFAKLSHENQAFQHVPLCYVKYTHFDRQKIPVERSRER